MTSTQREALSKALSLRQAILVLYDIYLQDDYGLHSMTFVGSLN